MRHRLGVDVDEPVLATGETGQPGRPPVVRDDDGVVDVRDRRRAPAGRDDDLAGGAVERRDPGVVVHLDAEPLEPGGERAVDEGEVED